MKILCILVSLLLAVGCGSGNRAGKAHDHAHTQQEGHDHEAEGEEHHAEARAEGHEHPSETGEKAIVFTAAQAQAAGMTLHTVEPVVFQAAIRTSGEILPTQEGESVVSAPTAGTVSFLQPGLVAGRAVRAGEPLFSLSTRTLENGDYLSRLKSSYEAAKKEYDRAESLIGDKLISEKAYNEARLNYENARTAYEPFARAEGSDGVVVKAVKAGYVDDVLVREGQQVAAGEALLLVSDNNTLMLKANLSQKYYDRMGSITGANFRLPGSETCYALSEMNGRRLSFTRREEAGGNRLPLYFEFRRGGAPLVTGSFVEVILLAEPKPGTLTVPLAALTEEQGVYFVYVQESDEHYRKQEVRRGADDGRSVEILSGVKPGDRVVAQGAYSVKLAASSKEIPHGHTH